MVCPTLKSLSCHLNIWKPLVPTACLGVLIIYGLADRLRNFVAAIFIPQYHYPYVVALCFAEVLVSLALLHLLHALGIVPLRHYSKSLGEKLLVPAICDSIQAVLALWEKASSSYTGLSPLILCLLPLLTVAWSHILRLAAPPSIHVSVLIAIISGASVVITASHSLLSIEPLECMYAVLGLILQSVSLTWLAKVSELQRCHSPDASILDVYYTQRVNQSWVLGALWLLHPDGPRQVLGHGSWHSLLFHGYLLAILLLGVLLNLLVGVTTLACSPLAAALLHSAREQAKPFLRLL